MATTTNYGWTTPDDTALVKDGASAIRSLGTAIDTTTKNLNPSTTLGDIEYRSSTANTNTRLAIGTSGQVLTVSGGVPAWATPASGGMTSIASGTLSGSSVVLGSIPGTYNQIALQLNDWYNAGNGNSVYVRITGITTSYFGHCVYAQGTSYGVESEGTASFTSKLTYASQNTDNNHTLYALFPNYADTTARKICIGAASYLDNGNLENTRKNVGVYNQTGAITSLTLSVEGGGNFSGGTYTLWGIK